MVDELADFRMNFNEDNLLALNIAIAVIMFGVALGIEKSKFVEIIKNPKGIITGVVSQFILLPVLTFLFIYIAKPLPSLALGMIFLISELSRPIHI